MHTKNLTLFICLFFIGITHTLSQIATIVESEENDLKVNELGTFIQSQIHENNPTAYLSKFDAHIIKDKVIEIDSEIIKTSEDEKDFDKGLLNGFLEFPNKIITSINNGAFYDFINYRYDEETQSYHMLFRFFHMDEGINYHDYKVSIKDNEFMFDDMYIYLSGEYISDTFTRIFQYTSPNSTKDNSSDFKKYSKALVDVRVGNFENAYNLLNALTTDLANEKFIHINKIQIASKLDETIYMEAIESLKNTFQNDPTIYLTLIDYYIMKEEYDVAFDLVDNLQVETSDDFLNYIKGNVAYARADYEGALNYFNYMIENYPDFYQPYVSNVSVYTQQQQFDEALLVLDKLVERDYDKQILIEYIEEVDENGLNELESLANSKAYKKWKKK
jgi:tetratricopeptide (TPR) repeat protein